MLKSITLAAAFTLSLITPTLAQSVSFPNPEFAAPGTFCAPMQLCDPVVTISTSGE